MTSSERQPAPTAQRPCSKQLALIVAVGTTAVWGATLALAAQPIRSGSIQLLWIPGAVALVLAATTTGWLHRRGLLAERLTPKRGDITLGFLGAFGLYLLGMAGVAIIAARGTPQEAWLMRLYAHVGDPTVTRTFAVGAAMLVLGALEELAWRGGVMGCLTDAFGARRAWVVSTGLYALAFIPTLWLFGGPLAGPNPILMLGALACGLACGGYVALTGRLAPAMLAHGLVCWAVVEFPLWRL